MATHYLVQRFLERWPSAFNLKFYFFTNDWHNVNVTQQNLHIFLQFLFFVIFMALTKIRLMNTDKLH